MGLDALMVNRLASLLTLPKMRVASFGYPDILLPVKALYKLAPEGSSFEIRKDSEEICRRHGKRPQDIVDAASFFRAFGAELTVFDIVMERGCEIACDLNLPMRATDTQDIVIDPGTLEHCFNIGQAAFNMAGIVSEGGYILHSNPFAAGNHGFYGLNPTWYADFYGQNGFELLSCEMRARAISFAPMTDTGRFCPTVEHHLFAVARRIEVRPLTHPVQSKYKHSIGKERP